MGVVGALLTVFFSTRAAVYLDSRLFWILFVNGTSKMRESRQIIVRVLGIVLVVVAIARVEGPPLRIKGSFFEQTCMERSLCNLFAKIICTY